MKEIVGMLIRNGKEVHAIEVKRAIFCVMTQTFFLFKDYKYERS